MPIFRLWARNLPGLRPLNLQLSSTVALFGHYCTSSLLLKYLGEAAACKLDVGSVISEFSGPVRVAEFGPAVDAGTSRQLHAYWARRIQRSSQLKLVEAWAQLWGAGDGLGELAATAGDNPILIVRPDEYSGQNTSFLAASALVNQGSGCNAAFHMLARVALQPNLNLILLDRPDHCLHPLIARRILRALRVLNPRAQIIAAPSSKYACEHPAWQVIDTLELVRPAGGIGVAGQRALSCG